MKKYYSLSYTNECGNADFIRGSKAELMKKYQQYKQMGVGSKFTLRHIRESYNQFWCQIFFEVLSSQKLP